MSSASSFQIAPAALAAAHHKPRREDARRTLRIGLLGFGNVGQAVARLTADEHTSRCGWQLRIADVLVRDPARPPDVDVPLSITTDASTFLRGRFDVVIEAPGTIEPARTLIAELLARGVPVVTANKALVAAHGRGLTTLAAQNGTSLRYEASALAGVPFLGALAARPLVSDIDRCAAVSTARRTSSCRGWNRKALPSMRSRGGASAALDRSRRVA